MILGLFALLLLYFWFLAQKAWGDKFIGYLKWSSLLFILVFLAFDAFMMLETDEMIKVRTIDPANGVTYSFFNNATNSTIETKMFAKQGDDTGTVMAYHWTEYAVMSIVAQDVGYLVLFIAMALVIQYLWIFYKNGIGEGDQSKEA